MTFITKLLYLYKNINHEICKFSIPIQQPNPLNRHWLVATLLNDGRFDEVKEFYAKEIKFHASEPNTICCLKNLLDPESFARMMQVLKSPTLANGDKDDSIIKKLRWMWLLAISNEEYILNEKTKRLYSALDVLWIIPTNMVAPFMYLVDIIKDSLQLSILLISIGGIKNVIQNPTSFSSVIIGCNFLTIIVPIVVTGTIKQRKAERSSLKRLFTFFVDMITSVLVHPIKLHYDLVVAKCVREKLLESKLTSLITHFEENESIIKHLEEEKGRHIKLQPWWIEFLYGGTLRGQYCLKARHPGRMGWIKLSAPKVLPKTFLSMKRSNLRLSIRFSVQFICTTLYCISFTD